MDNSRGWGPRPAAVATVAVGGVAMAGAALALAVDPVGRVLSGIAAIGLLVFAAGSWRARPRLAIDGDALVYRGWLHTRLLRHEDIDMIRITEFRRLTRKVRLLEIDMRDGGLLVLSRWDLGGDPLTVLDALTHAGWAGR